ncbi:MAG TPA: GDP-mannose 4,6-dehydratase [bacterium]|nr:GDP-mannose 4,6-dehydratase [bacterium]
MSEEFWKKKRVLITGYEGFVGSHLTGRLLALGADVCGMDIITRRKKTLLTLKELSLINVKKESLENYKALYGIIRKNRIEIVFHLAAKALVGECLKDPLDAFASNIQGTWNVLEACRQSNNVNCLIVASSDKAYGKQKLPYRENMPLQGQHPYDASKSCGDILAQMYFHTYGLPVAVTRCGNIYGPGDFNFSRIVPDAVRCALLNKPFIIRSDGKFTRDYIFVEDIVDGYVMLAEKFQKLDLAGEAFNFSDEKPLSVIELVETIYQIAKREPDYKILNEAECEIKHQYLSSSKARKILGWKPRYNLMEGLEKTITWYKKNFENCKGKK